MAKTYDFQFKLELVGGSFVGKTAISNRFTKDLFTCTEPVFGM